MRARRLLPRVVLAIALAVAVAAAPSARAATPADRAASRAYLGAASDAMTAFAADASRERDSVLAFVKRVAATCPATEVGEPAHSNAQVRIDETLTNETVADLALAAERPLRGAITTFLSRVSRLHFGEASIERVLRRAVRQYRAELVLAPTHLCADIRFARAHRWRRLSPASRRFAAAFAATQSPPQPTTVGLGRRMRALLGPSERRALRRLAAEQSMVDTRLGRLISNELNAIFAALD